MPRHWAPTGAAVVAVLILGLAMLDAPQRAMLRSEWWPQFWTNLPVTVSAALRVWMFWAIATFLLAAAVARYDPDLDALDLLLLGGVGVWVAAFIGGNALGPIGLLRPWAVTAVVAVGLAASIRTRAFPRWRVTRHTGFWLVVLTLAIALPTMVLLQLGTIMPPYMDVIATPAAAQRTLTFGYMPWDNDPYGIGNPSSQCPGMELLDALVTAGGWLPYAVLGTSASIVPMVVLFVLAMYRLGRTAGGDTTGGIVALIGLFATVFCRSLPYMHGRHTAFVLVAAGLGFLFAPTPHRLRTVAGALCLGTAVATHAIVGAFGMTVAALVVVGWLVDGAWKEGACGVAVLAGAALVAFPEIAVALRWVLPYPLLPLVQGLGVLIVAWASAGLASQHSWRLPSAILSTALALAIGWMMLRQTAVLAEQENRFPLLYWGAIAGLLALCRRGETRARVLVTATLVVGVAALWSRTLGESLPPGEIRWALQDFSYKAEYWVPWALTLPVALVLRWPMRWAPRTTTVALVAVLALPVVRPYRDPNAYAHSIAEGIVYQLEFAKIGYWGSTGDRRWADGPAGMHVSRVLRDEIEAGRITAATHVVHVYTHHPALWGDNPLFSAYTGINDDGYVPGYSYDVSIAEGRLRPIEELENRLRTAPPPYMVIQERARDESTFSYPPGLLPLLDDYEDLVHEDGLRLLRRRDVRGGGESFARPSTTAMMPAVDPNGRQRNP